MNHQASGQPGEVRLRDVSEADLPIFFVQQLDPAANYMAAFTAPDPTDRPAFMLHWARILADPTIAKRTILVDGQVAGSIVCFEEFGEPQVGYWLGQEYWGRGVATRALRAFLQEQPLRPLYGRAADDNRASIRVLEKCGFQVIDEATSYANARGAAIREVILILREP